MDQARAISCGLAMIQRTEKTPKFLLIHGPPGTGKSKTIGGLLYKLLSSVFIFLSLHTVHAHKDTLIILQLSRYIFAECVLCVCGYLVRVITVLLLWGTFTPRLEGHVFFSVRPLTLPSIV